MRVENGGRFRFGGTYIFLEIWLRAEDLQRDGLRRYSWAIYMGNIFESQSLDEKWCIDMESFELRERIFDGLGV